MKYLLVFTILIFAGCDDYEFTKKKNKEVDNFVHLMADVNNVVKNDSVVIKENTEILLEIKDGINKLVNNGVGEVQEKSPAGNLCDCETTGVCDCANCECDFCKGCVDGVCPVVNVENALIPQKKSITPAVKSTSKKVEKSTTEPKEAKHVWGTSPTDYRIVKYGTSWCGGCKVFKDNEEPKLLAGCKVESRDPKDWPNENVRIMPTVKLFVYNGSNWEHVATFLPSSTSIPRASSINNKIKSEMAKRGAVNTSVSTGVINTKQVNGRLSNQYLRSWIISSGYNQSNCTKNADVQPRSYVWKHLTESEHGFTNDQVRNLPQWMALALHNASHIKQITPFG